MEKRKCIISNNINSDTPEIPSNRRGLHRAMHFGRKCCSFEVFSLNYTVYINIILQQVWLGLPLKKTLQDRDQYSVLYLHGHVLCV